MARANGEAGGAIRGRRPKGQGPDLRQTILDAAEALFSRHGFYGVTVRQVAAEAGVDTALIHYYFGAKRELFESVFSRRAGILNDERIAAMQAYADAHPGAMEPEGVIAAFIDPRIQRSMTNDGGWKNYFRLVALVNNTPAWGGETMHRFFDPVVHQLVDMLKLALPDAEVAARREAATQRLRASGAHLVIDSVAQLPEALAEIDARMARGERP